MSRNLKVGIAVFNLSAKYSFDRFGLITKVLQNDSYRVKFTKILRKGTHNVFFLTINGQFLIKKDEVTELLFG
jgi:hypothetical protein